MKTQSISFARQALLGAFMLVMLMPFYWLVISSLKAEDEMFTMPIRWLPSRLYLDNYRYAMAAAPFLRYYLNSLTIALTRIAGCLLFSSVTAFAFAKLRFRMKNGLFLVYLSTLMLPAQLTTLPLYLTMSRIGWVDTYLPLTVALFFDAYVVFMLRQFFIAVPDSLLEAAKIDGAGYPRMYFTIMLPLSKAALASMAILLFIWSWNDVLGPLIFINSQRLQTVALGMNIFKTAHNTRYGPLFAASAISLVPMLAVYVVGQRFFEQGIATAGLKG
ncbi:MAG: carbohydrate ABC transporter permease [Clostridiales bacterium]|nr:carbohydrate ABC transporter permease [Clostridiales bacterium]